MRSPFAAALALLSAVQSVPVRPAPSQPAEADFEAALRAGTPPAPAVPAAASPAASNRYVGQSSMERPAAPRGVIPPRWRTLKAMPDQTDEIQADVTEGRLDPLALMEQISGPLPLPPGALPIMCGRIAGTVSYTMGIDLSPRYADLAARARRGADVQDATDQASVETKPVRATLRRFFVQRGLREFISNGARAGFFDAKRALRVWIDDTSALWRQPCLGLPRPITLPSGPILRFEHASSLSGGDRFVDEQSAPAGRRVVQPFG